MSKVLIDRAVVEQALHALNYSSACISKQLTTQTKHDYALGLLAVADDALRAALEQPQVEQEPVAEVIESHVRAGLDGLFTAEVASRERLSVGAELFIHTQPPRQPLSDATIDAMFANASTGEYLAERERKRHLEIYSFGVRDAEAAHGIGGEK